MDDRLLEIDTKLSELRRESDSIRQSLSEVDRRIAELENLKQSYKIVAQYEAGQLPPLPGTSLDEPLCSSPRNFRRPQYAGKDQFEMVSEHLSDHAHRRFGVDDLVVAFFEVNPGTAEYKRARVTLGTALSRGISKGLWDGKGGKYWALAGQVKQ